MFSTSRPPVWVMWNWLLSGLATGAACMLLRRLAVCQWRPHPVGLCRAGTLYAVRYQRQVRRDQRGRRGAAPFALIARATRRAVDRFTAAAGELRLCLRVQPDVHLASISGGTDIMACFALGNPSLPVSRRAAVPGAGDGDRCIRRRGQSLSGGWASWSAHRHSLHAAFFS